MDDQHLRDTAVPFNAPAPRWVVRMRQSLEPFRARARALDMLGRQQIAGIPTAISELFKNAHDAYADKVVVDYYLSDGLFVLRDDGAGMTGEDFLGKWLVVGTESKYEKASREKQEEPPPFYRGPPRALLGEKGVGRLAVSVIGPQVLVLTRAVRQDGPHGLVAAFIHWGLFEVPGIDLADVKVPVFTYEADQYPDARDVRRLVALVRYNLAQLKPHITPEKYREIQQDLRSFRIDPAALSKFMDPVSLLGSSKDHGTHFYIRPSDPSLGEDLERERRDQTGPSRLTKLLLGFTNSMTDEVRDFSTHFNYHHINSSSDDLIAGRSFWQPDDFHDVDHIIEGAVDEKGYFKGLIKIYDQEPFSYELAWPGAGGRQIACGPFEIKFGYLQGVQHESILAPDRWAAMMEKLRRIGGLYIYRDGIRVLPYGEIDVDFLEIEKRRTINAGRNFFSYRRMFGAIKITHENNSALQEKAGREGFRENRAYRDFRGVLINLLEQLAREYFGTTARQRDVLEERRKEIERAHQARRERDERAERQREALEHALDRFFVDLPAGKPVADVGRVVERFEARLTNLEKTARGEQFARQAATLQGQAQDDLLKVRGRLTLQKPAGVGLPAKLNRDWEAYQREYERLLNELWTPAYEYLGRTVQERLRESEQEGEAEESYEAVARARLIDRLEEAGRGITRETSELKATVAALGRAVDEAFLPDRVRLDELLGQLRANGKETDADTREHIERELLPLNDRVARTSAKIARQLELAAWRRAEDGEIVGFADVAASIEDELFAAQARVDDNVELAQLGMAIELIDHEFASAIAGVRGALGDLRPFAARNPRLQKIDDELRLNFEHLDAYLRLFRPLQRRAHRTRTQFKGAAIARYLERLFGDRMRQLDVYLRATPRFNDFEFNGYPSSFYPVFVNLVDNSLYWLERAEKPREIRLDAENGAVTVSDNGPGIPPRDREAVFDLGFSRRPGGRGLGLYISRQVLEREDYELRLLPGGSVMRTVFEIRPVPDKALSEEDRIQ